MSEDDTKIEAPVNARKNLIEKRYGRRTGRKPVLIVVVGLIIGGVVGLLAGYILWGRAHIAGGDGGEEQATTEESEEVEVFIPGQGSLDEVFGDDVVFFVPFPDKVDTDNPEATREEIREFIEVERRLKEPFISALVDEGVDIPVRLVVVDDANHKLCEVYLSEVGSEPNWFLAGLEKDKDYQVLMENLLARLATQQKDYVERYMLSERVLGVEEQVSAFQEMATLASGGLEAEMTAMEGGRSYEVSFLDKDTVHKFSLDLGFNQSTMELEVKSISMHQ